MTVQTTAQSQDKEPTPANAGTRLVELTYSVLQSSTPHPLLTAIPPANDRHASPLSRSRSRAVTIPVYSQSGSRVLLRQQIGGERQPLPTTQLRQLPNCLTGPPESREVVVDLHLHVAAESLILYLEHVLPFGYSPQAVSLHYIRFHLERPGSCSICYVGAGRRGGYLRLSRTYFQPWTCRPRGLVRLYSSLS